VWDTLATRAFTSVVFGVPALSLAAIGIYGVISYAAGRD
jgi:hypothetical protein